MSFIDELKRRNVFKVGTAYVIVAWLLLQVASVILPTFRTPDWVMQAFTVLLFLGFPLALILAWAFELTPEGIKRDEDVVRSGSIARLTSRKLDYFIIAALSLALVFVVIDQYVLEEEAAPSALTDPADLSVAIDAVSTVPERSIAVLPFRNRSAVAEDAYFVDGIHDDILTQLSKLSSLEKVISRTTVEQYRETSKTMPQIGQELGVATLLEGGVQRAGDRVRINVQLIDASSDQHLWAETYDRQLTPSNIFSIQSEIAMAIAAALHGTLSLEEQQYIATVPTENLEAYEAYQLGKQQLERRSLKSVDAAIGLFVKATTIDPGFVRAWTKLAHSYLVMAWQSGQDVDELVQNADAAVQKALLLDDQLSETQTALASVLRNQGDMQGAMRAIERATKLNPNYAYAHFTYANMLHDSGYPDEALFEYEQAVRLDPLSPVLLDAYAFTLSEVGRFDEALTRYRKLEEIDPAYPDAGQSIGTIYGLSYGRLDLANLWYRKSLALDPGVPWISAILGLVFLELDDDDTAEFWINRALQQGPESSWANGAMTMLQSYRGDSEKVRKYATEVARTDPRWRFGTALSHGRVQDLREGKYEEVLSRYQSSFPELFEEIPAINGATYKPAIDVAGLLLLSGETERAEELLGLCQEQVAETVRVGIYGFWVSDVQILALQGKTADALSALRQAYDQSWVTDWRYFYTLDPNLDSIREKPEFQAIFAEIKEDMVSQLEQVREMEREGSLAAIPPLDD